jgi:hypothetical protein
MKRSSNIAAVVGFLLVLAFAAERFLHVRALWAGLSWTDLRDVGHDLVGLGLLILMLAAILLAVLWGGCLLWRSIRPETRSAQPQHSGIASTSQTRTDNGGIGLRRGQVIAGTGGCLAILWLIVRRFSQAHASSFYVGNDLRPDFVSFGVGCAVVAVISVAGGDLLWQRIRRKPVETVPTETRHPSSVPGWHIFGMCIISAVASFAATVATMGGYVASPGWRVSNPLRNWAYGHDLHPNFWQVFLPPMVVDGSICFAILCGAYMLWGKVRRKEQLTPRIG